MDTIQQAAASVEGDVSAVQTAAATSGAVAAVAVAGADVAGIAGQAINSAAEGVADLANAAPGAIADVKEDGNVVETDAESLFGKVRDEIEGLVDLAGHEWDLLKAAIAKHL
jgi:hypothetical protein